MYGLASNRILHEQAVCYMALMLEASTKWTSTSPAITGRLCLVHAYVIPVKFCNQRQYQLN